MLWRDGFASPDCEYFKDWFSHVYREHNTEADKIADIASQSGSESFQIITPISPENLGALRIFFDGTAGKSSEPSNCPAAGILLQSNPSQGDPQGRFWRDNLRASIPLDVPDSTWAELRASQYATAIANFVTKNRSLPVSTHQLELQ